MKTNGYVTTKEFCEQLRLKLSGEDDREDAFLYVRRNAAPAWALRPKGSQPTPSEAWGIRLEKERKLRAAYSDCCRAIEELESV